MTVNEAYRTLKDLHGSFGAVAYDGGMPLIEEAVGVMLADYERQTLSMKEAPVLDSSPSERPE